MQISLARLESTGGYIDVRVGQIDVARVPCAGLLTAFRRIDVAVGRNSVGHGPAKRAFERVLGGELEALDPTERAELAYAMLHDLLNGPTAGDLVRKRLLAQLKRTPSAILEFGETLRPEKGREWAVLSHRDAAVAEPGPVATAKAAMRGLPPPEVGGGAGYPIDRALRTRIDVVHLYEHQANYALLNQGSFTVFDRFITRNVLADPYSHLLPEIDHAFDLDDFYTVHDYTGFPEDAYQRLEKIPEQRIHHYTPLNPWIFADLPVDPAPNIVAGFSLVRHGHTLYWILLGGPILDLEAQADWLVPMLQGEPTNLSASAARKLQPKPLVGTSRVWGTTLWGSFDLRSQDFGPFGVSLDMGETLDCYLDLATNPERLIGIEAAGTTLLKNLPIQDLFGYVREMLNLPLYFQTRVEYVKNLPVRPRRAGMSPSESRQPPITRAYRTVATLHAIAQSRPAMTQTARDEQRTQRREPEYKVTLNGTWRTLKPTQIGRGPDGKPVIGRTWVTEHSRYKDKPERPSLIRVKQPVAASIETAESESADGHIAIRY
jgi:hypothetical protein